MENNIRWISKDVEIKIRTSIHENLKKIAEKEGLLSKKP